jgi:hypothetical protein
MTDRMIRDEHRAGTPTRGDALDVAPTWLTRMRATLFADRYDHEIEAGITAAPGSPVAAHAARLASTHEREELCGALHLVMSDALAGARGARVPVRAAAVRQSADVISDILDRLGSPHPARVRGMARLRIVLSDGRGPLYRAQSGSLSAALRGVLAAL